MKVLLQSRQSYPSSEHWCSSFLPYCCFRELSAEILYGGLLPSRRLLPLLSRLSFLLQITKNTAILTRIVVIYQRLKDKNNQPLTSVYQKNDRKKRSFFLFVCAGRAENQRFSNTYYYKPYSCKASRRGSAPLSEYVLKCHA